MLHPVPGLIAAAALTASTIAFGQTTAAPPAASPLAAAVDDQATIDVLAKRLCKAEPIIGTRIPIPRKCVSTRELAHYREQAREMLENYRRRPCAMGASSGEGQVLSC